MLRVSLTSSPCCVFRPLLNGGLPHRNGAGWFSVGLDARWIVQVGWQRRHLYEIVHVDLAGDAAESLAQAEAGREPVHSVVMYLAQVPAQLAVILSPVALRAELHLHRFLPVVGSDEHAVGSASRTSPQTSVQVAGRSQFVPQQLPLRDPAGLGILIQHPRCDLD